MDMKKAVEAAAAGREAMAMLFEGAFKLFHQRRQEEERSSHVHVLRHQQPSPAFEKRGIKLELFRRVAAECKSRNIANDASKVKWREAVAAGCVRYVVTHVLGLPAYKVPCPSSSDLVRRFELGDFIDARPGSTTVGIEEGAEYAGLALVQLLDDGAGWVPLCHKFEGVEMQSFLQVVGPVPEEAFVGRPGYWTIGRVSALVIGNHEILKAGNRWEADQGGQAIDPSSTLTHAGRCSLIDSLLQGHFEAPDAPLGGNLRYDDVVGAKADIFVSFAYACDFIELVDALERIFENSPSLDKDNTYLWFDLFVNDQWAALDKPFEWWATTFKEAVEEIGHTVVVMLPWEAPIPLTRVWCLFEIACSKKLSIAMSSTQVKAFHVALRNNPEAIISSLCKIDVEKATSFTPEDKEKIFAVVSAREGGFHGINVDVSYKMRKWVEDATMELVTEAKEAGGGEARESFSENKGMEKQAKRSELQDMFRAGSILLSQGKYDEAVIVHMRAIQGFEKLCGPDDDDTLGAMNGLANVLKEQGKLEEAERMYSRVLDAYDALHGRDDVKSLILRHNLGTLYRQLARLDEAEAMLSFVLARREKLIGETHSDTLKTMMNLSNVLNQQGKKDEALALCTRALELSQKTLGDDHPNTLNALSNLSTFYHECDKFDEAAATIKRTLAGYEKVFGPNHPSALAALINLGSVFKSQGKLIEALDAFVRAFEGFKNVLGEEHPNTVLAAKAVYTVQKLISHTRSFTPRPSSASSSSPLPSLPASHYASMSTKELKAAIVAAGLGHRLLGLSEKSELVALITSSSQGDRQQTVLTSEKDRGKSNQRKEEEEEEEEEEELDEDELAALSLLAVSFSSQGMKEEAEKAIMRVLHATERNLGLEHKKTLTMVSAVATLHFEHGNFAAAQAMYTRSLEGLEKLYGVDHAESLSVMHQLSITFAQQGLLDEAEAMLIRTLAGEEKVLGSDHAHTKDARSLLLRVKNGIRQNDEKALDNLMEMGSSFSHEGRLVEAEEFYLRALKGLEKMLDEHHPKLLNVMGNLGRVYGMQGKWAESEIILLRVLRGNENSLGESHPGTLMIMEMLCDVYEEQGKWDEAEIMLTRTLACQEKIHGVDNEKTRNTHRTLAHLRQIINSTKSTSSDSSKTDSFNPSSPATVASASSSSPLHRLPSSHHASTSEKDLKAAFFAAILRDRSLGPSEKSELIALIESRSQGKQQDERMP